MTACCGEGGFPAADLGQTSIHYQGKTGPFGSRGAIEEYIGNNELAAEAVKRYAGAGIIKTVDEYARPGIWTRLPGPDVL